MRSTVAVLTLACIIALPLGAPAVAQEMPSMTGLYLQAYGGLRVPDNLQLDGTAQDLGLGTTLGASVGVNTSVPGLSGDLDYMRSSTSYSGLGTSLDSQSLMVDAQYAPQLNFGIDPYAGVGLGVVNASYKNESGGTAPAFQFKLGADMPITNQLSWFGEYRYQQAFGHIDSSGHDLEYASHSILVGLKLSFDTPSGSGSYASSSYGGY